MKKLIILLALLAPIPTYGAISNRDKAEIGVPTNYILNGGFESGSAGVKTFADAAATLPADGTGGSPSHITLSTTTSAQIAGKESLKIVNSGSTSAQGEGASIGFTIDPEQEGHQLTISMSYLVASGTFQAGSDSQDSDLEVYVYDVTNSQLIQPVGYKLSSNSTTVAGHYVGTFQAASNSTSYRLIFFVPTTNTSSWSLVLDSITVSSQKYATGPPVLDWKSYTPTLTGFGTTSSVSFQYARVGDTLKVIGRFSNGSNTSVTPSLSLPTGLSIDTAKLGSSIYAVGTYGTNEAAVRHGNLLAGYDSSLIYFTVSTTTGELSRSTLASTDIGSSTSIWIRFSVPILGWSSGVTMSNDSSGRTVVATYSVSATQSIATSTETALNFGTNALDVSGGSVTSTSPWTFTAGEHEYVHVNANTRWAATPSGQIYLGVKVNSGTSKRIWDNNNIGEVAAMSGGIDLELNAGDTVKIVAFQSSGSSLSIDNAAGNVSIHKIGGSQTIAASGTVAAKYNTNTANTMADSTITILNFDNKIFDYTGAVTTGSSWKFQPGVSGLYSVKAFAETAATTVTNSEFLIYLYKNGSADSIIGKFLKEDTVSNPMHVVGDTEIRLMATDYIDIRGYQNTGSSLGLFTGSHDSYVSITRIGNY